jgi:hypothetical protein
MKNMKMKMMGILVPCVLLAVSCTENSRAKTFGGTMTVDLPPNAKLDSATWKNEELWYLTRPMRTDEVAETWTMQEDSSFGMIEGQVIFKETKK